MLASQKIHYTRAVQTSQDSRLKLIEDIISFLDRNSFDTEMDRYELYLILDEAVTNAMEHGNRWVPDKQVFVRVYQESQESDSIRIGVRDEGLGFNTENIPSDLRLNGSLSPRGRGLYIIKKFCELEFNRLGNEITLICPLNKE